MDRRTDGQINGRADRQSGQLLNNTAYIGNPARLLSRVTARTHTQTHARIRALIKSNVPRFFLFFVSSRCLQITSFVHRQRQRRLKSTEIRNIRKWSCPVFSHVRFLVEDLSILHNCPVHPHVMYTAVMYMAC